MWNRNNVRAVFDHCTISGNSSAEGGGIHTSIKTTVTNSQFRENTALIRGGAVFGGKADMSLNAATIFIGNDAPPQKGDGIAWVQGQGGTLDNNAEMVDDSVNFIDP